MNDPARSPREGADPRATSLRIVQVLLGLALVTVAFAMPVRPSSHVEASFGGGEDPCVAQIVGLVQAQVLWFNGTPFFDREEFTGDTHLYVTEAGAPNPSQHVGPDALASGEVPDAGEQTEGSQEDYPALIRSGQYYNFTDANGFTWNVTEAYMDVGVDPYGSVDQDGFVDTDDNDREAEGDARTATKRFYTWIVEIDDARSDNNIGVPSDIGSNGEYNFATRVNTTKFTNDTREEAAEVTHTNSTSTLGTDLCHPDHDHVHRQYDADLWLGRQPDLVPLDCEPLYSVSASALASYTDESQEPTGNVTGSYRGGTCASGQVLSYLEGEL